MKLSPSTTLFYAAAVQFVLVQILVLSSLAESPKGQPGLAEVLTVLLSVGCVVSVLTGLALRLSDRTAGTTSRPTERLNEPPTREGSHATPSADEPISEASEASTQTPRGVEATSSESRLEADYVFWRHSLAFGVCTWFFVLLSFFFGGGGDSSALFPWALLLYLLLALPIAIICMIAAGRRHDTNPAEAVALLKRPFYYGFGGLALLFVLDLTEDAIRAFTIGRHMRM